MVRGVEGVVGTFALYRTQKAMTIKEEKCGFYKKFIAIVLKINLFL